MSSAEDLADAILRAAGSGLKHYSIPAVRQNIIAAAQAGIDAALESAATHYDDLAVQHERRFEKAFTTQAMRAASNAQAQAEMVAADLRGMKRGAQ